MSQNPLYFVVFTQLQFYSSQVSLSKRPKMDSTSNTKFETVNEYMSALPESTRVKLEKLRQTIKKAAPQAEEVISYNMPAYKQEGMLVYYAAYKGHIGFYPTASPIKAFKEELADYSGSKGTVRFPLDKPIPSGLVSRIVKYKVKENLEKAHAKTMKKTTTKGRK